jgi:hypothetical protein
MPKVTALLKSPTLLMLIAKLTPLRLTRLPEDGAAEMPKSPVLNDRECHVHAVAQTTACARDCKGVSPRRGTYRGCDSQR